MADYIEISDAYGNPVKVSVDEIATIFHQRHKMQFGPDGSAVDVSSENPLPVTDHLLDIVEGSVPGHAIVHKFGMSASLDTTLRPVSSGGIYITPQVAGATALRVKAGGDANDDAAGSGAREVMLEGLDETGALVSEAVATAGASASLATTTTFMRLFRTWVSKSGTYATATAGSHAATITIENGAGGTDWATIDLNSLPNSQSLIGVYTVPLGKTGYLLGGHINVDASKPASVLSFKRENILETAAPYSAMRLQSEYVGVAGSVPIILKSPKKFDALTDFGFMAKVASGTGDISIDFEIMLVDD